MTRISQEQQIYIEYESMHNKTIVEVSFVSNDTLALQTNQIAISQYYFFLTHLEVQNKVKRNLKFNLISYWG